MDAKFLDHLIEVWECSTIDFKEVFHGNNAELIHDILCLSNAYADDDRFMVFGVANEKRVVGVLGDINRKRSADLQDLLRQANFNRIPDIIIRSIDYQQFQVDIIKIANRPDEPFYLTRDKIEGKATVRAGVVYTRLVDTNTPLKECASDDRVELMWRERFGMGKPPINRVLVLLGNPDNWTSPEENEMHHNIFAEFTIVDRMSREQGLIDEWVKKFKDTSYYRRTVELRYFGTLLKSMEFVICDGGRYYIPLPEIRKMGEQGAEYYLNSNSIEYKVALIYNIYLEKIGESIEEMLKYVGIDVI